MKTCNKTIKKEALKSTASREFWFSSVTADRLKLYHRNSGHTAV